MKETSVNKDLYVSEISFAAEEEDLRKLFAICGKVRSIHLITDQKSGLFKGCAFVSMSTAAEAKDALTTLDGTRLIDRCISVTVARPKKSVPSAAEGTFDTPRQKRRPGGRRK